MNTLLVFIMIAALAIAAARAFPAVFDKTDARSNGASLGIEIVPRMILVI